MGTCQGYSSGTTVMSNAPHNGRHEPSKTHGKTPIHSRFTKIIISETSAKHVEFALCDLSCIACSRHYMFEEQALTSIDGVWILNMD